MKFRYRKINLIHPFLRKKYILRPIIPVSLSFQQSSIRYEALIDSGSDFNIFPTEIAQKLNINLKSRKRIYFSGIEDSSIEGHIANIFLGLGNNNLKTNVVFTDLPSVSGILGQNGFFDLFIVKFDLVREEIEIKTR
ncbi:hypothetical protein A3B51_03465 [Candidatus Curtissbacteria bacterium RIFCSPLOWO2_01_FULL_41_18]|uniref:Peptidase A2 domain-containing protein n=2 Tax=Candidatus Curtissiibacteriota TaxID=1752717 RepID=A0A1F5FXU7_9BACT|nr:MAG: hypothetical protein A2696_01590 [Candidatus Curtissbacteria bacterium RIFCSPHIGHO2_01_FULL_41_13]OGE04825.1 MAG: hypothetical protein A3B51_03465 [Candidatus Curtissbacteria bacterium RIFCSPLOWO2_01_FULL_41_18]